MNTILKDDELKEILKETIKEGAITEQTIDLILRNYIVIDFNWENVKLLLEGANK